MAEESKTTMESVRSWVVQHKLRTVGCLWLSGITGSIAYNWSRPQMKTSVRIIHARLHAQAFTLAALAGAAVVEYYEHKNSQDNREARGIGHLPAARTGSSKLTSIYQLGDSLSDTGNLIIESPNGVASAFAQLSYGESFFKHPTGRCSNGLLMIDFLAKALDIPRLNPYLNRDADFTHGVNFAVAGATALPMQSLAEKNIVNPVTNSSLSVQLDWMWSHFNSICYNDQDCAEKLKNSLFIVGEIGSNDYYYALSQGKTMKDVNTMVFDVVQAIIEGVIRVIESGAIKIIVPGTFSLGHFPAYITACQAKNSAAYRKQRLLNNFSLYHNDELQKRLQLLKQDYKNITIIYGDYYNAFNRLLLNAPHVGFNGTSDLRKACCGAGGRFSFNPTRTCGARGVPVCANPDGYVIWDGFNLTQKAYRILAQWLFQSTISRLINSP